MVYPENGMVYGREREVAVTASDHMGASPNKMRSRSQRLGRIPLRQNLEVKNEQNLSS